ncbi:MAG: translation initiation factor IF-5A [Nanoarchaeota archaeon]
MAMKLITAHEARTGATILVEGNACIVRSNDVSKTGKHGASKCRIEAIGVLDGKKRIVAVPGSERFDVPLIEKKKAQVLSITPAGDMANIMDLETFETMDMPIMEEAKGTFAPEDQVEYMIVDERIKVIKRKL